MKGPWQTLLIGFVLLSLRWPATTCEAGEAVGEPTARGVWVQTNGPHGGIMNTVEVDLNNPDTVYLGGEGGGVFKSTDAGATWRLLGPIAPQNQQVAEVLVSPVDSRTIYAAFFAGRLYKSTDGGGSWLPFDPPNNLRSLAMSPADPGALIAGGWGQVHVSTDGGATWTDHSSAFTPDAPFREVGAGAVDEFWLTIHTDEGQLFHTIDGGDSWDQVDVDEEKPAGTVFTSIFVDPRNTQRVFVGLTFVSNLVGQAGDVSMFRTLDGGETWDGLTLPGPPVGGEMIGYDPSGETLYASNLNDLFTTTDSGDSWTLERSGRRSAASTSPIFIRWPWSRPIRRVPSRHSGAAARS